MISAQHWRTHWSVRLHGWCVAPAGLSWPSLYLFHKTGSNECGIGLMTTPESSASDSLVWTLEPAVSAMWTSWSVLTAIFHIWKELQSSIRVCFCSAVTHSWSCPHMFWQFSLILFSWASTQRLLLPSLQEAHTLFQYLLCAVWMETSSVYEHEMQSSEAVSMSESPTFSLSESESDEAWSSVFHKLSVAASSSASAMALVGQEGGLSGSCSHCSELGLASGIGSGILSLLHVELWSLPALTSWELTQVLLP